MGSVKGYVSEAFPSIQGEGLFAGEAHVFIRLGGCPLRCVYCDTPYALEKSAGAVFYFAERREEIMNPVTTQDVIQFISTWKKEIAVEKLCITGGEPLLQPEFCASVGALAGLDVVFETSGTPQENFRELLGKDFYFALDVKLPYSSGILDGFEIFEKAMEILEGESVFVKAVVRSGEREIERAAEIVKSIMGRNVHFFIQPAEKIELHELLRLYKSARKHLSSVKILPQLHKQLGVK